jgi:hypothetical protein
MEKLLPLIEAIQAALTAGSLEETRLLKPKPRRRSRAKKNGKK